MQYFLAFLSLAATAWAQQENWKRPFPPHRIAGNLYYVGTEDLACFLLTTSEGNILINTGLSDSVPLIRDSVRKLGYKLEDTRILLTTQAHYDHAAGLAEIQKLSGAKVYATEADAPVLENGGKSDPFLDERYRFAPVRVDRKLKDGDRIRLGGTELHVHLTPGHTKGSVSYSMTLNDKGSKREVLVANMSTVVMPLIGNKWYPHIASDFERSFRVQKALAPEIWVAAHGSQYDMRRKHKSGSFIDPEGYRAAVARHESMFRARLAEESARR